MSDQSQNQAAISKLTDEVEKLNNHKFLKIQNSTPRMLGFQFMRGLAFGFGSVVGASIVVSIAGFILNQMEVVPIVGEWAKQVATEIMAEGQSSGTGTDTRVETGE